MSGYHSAPNIDSVDQILTQGFVSERNSTVVPLAGGATFLGPWVNVENYSHQAYLLNSDVSGTLYLQGAMSDSDSSDTDAAWDTQMVSVYSGNPTNALDAQLHTLAVVSKYVRVKYTNDGVAQTFLSIQASYHKYSSMHYTKLLNESLGDYTDSQVVRNVPTLKDALGNYVPLQTDSLAFSTTANLTSTATYTSGYLDARRYTQVQTHVLSNEDGTIVINFAKDSGGSDIVRTLTIPYTGGSGFQLFAAPCFSDYIEYRFTNDGLSTQTDFLYETKFLTRALQPQLLGAEAFIAPAMVSQLGRSVIVAKKPNDVYQNVNSDYNGDLRISVGAANQTAFGELKVANLTPVIEELFSYNVNDRKFNTTAVGSGTATQANAMAVVSTGTTTGSSCLLTTKKAIRYRAGLGVLSRFTAIFTSPVSGTTQMIGIGEDDDGFGFMYDTDQTFKILRRSSASGSIVDTKIAQADWSKDPADGTQTLPVIDFTKGNVFEIQIQYLGFGAIKFFIENPASGEFVLVHVIEYSNANTEPSLAIPSLPLSIQVDNGATTSDIAIKTASLAAFIEGQDKVLGVDNSINNSKSGIGSTETNIITLRNRSTFNSINNHNLIYSKLLNIATISGTKPTIIKVVKNCTLGGTPSYTDIDTNGSIGEYDTAGTTITNGNVVTSTVLGKEDRITIDLSKLGTFIGPSETLTVSASTASGSVEVYVALTSVDDI